MKNSLFISLHIFLFLSFFISLLISLNTSYAEEILIDGQKVIIIIQNSSNTQLEDNVSFSNNVDYPYGGELILVSGTILGFVGIGSVLGGYTALEKISSQMENDHHKEELALGMAQNYMFIAYALIAVATLCLFLVIIFIITGVAELAWIILLFMITLGLTITSGYLVFKTWSAAIHYVEQTTKNANAAEDEIIKNYKTLKDKSKNPPTDFGDDF